MSGLSERVQENLKARKREKVMRLFSSQAGAVISPENHPKQYPTKHLKKTSIKMDPLLWKRAKSLAIYSDRQLSELVAEGLDYIFKKYEKKGYRPQRRVSG